MGILTPDEMAGLQDKVSSKNMDIIMALIDTVKHTTDLENVYNDTTGQSFSWEEVRQMVDELVALKV